MRVCPFRPPVRCAVARLLFSLALATGLGGNAAPVRADIQAPIEAHTAGERQQRRVQQRDETPANAAAQTVQVNQGETVEIVLHARGQIGKTVEFILRSRPEHGTLEGTPRRLTNNTVSVTYVHRAEDGPAADGFSYAVQAANGPVSAAVPVTINVLDLPPSLVVSPAELDFGTVKAGESTRATLTLENRGGGTAFGRVEPPPPWVVDGSGDYHLARGESQSFQIVFQPAYGRSYAETAHFHTEDGQGVRLIGTGIGPRDPAEDLARSATTPAGTSPIADVIARDNALALAAENAARRGNAPTAAAGGSRPIAAAANAVSAPAAAATTPLPPRAESNGPSGNGAMSVGPNRQDSAVVNDAAVKTVELRATGSSTFDLAWKPPRPTPRSYRIELRYLTLDSDQRLRVDWRPYAKVDIRTTAAQVTARVSGLPEATRQTLRVVAVDDDGRLALPSPTVVAETRAASTWWHITPLKVLVAVLLVCLGLLVYRKWEEQQIMREIDASRAKREPSLTYR